VRSIAKVNTSKLRDYIGIQALKPFINKDLILGETIEFHIPGTQLMGRGITAERFFDICQAYVAALSANALTTDR